MNVINDTPARLENRRLKYKLALLVAQVVNLTALVLQFIAIAIEKQNQYESLQIRE